MMMVGWLVVFYIPSTARSFRDICDLKDFHGFINHFLFRFFVSGHILCSAFLIGKA